MPKAKPDEVVVHRIELQTTEREMLEAVSLSLAVKNIGEGLGAALSPLTQCTAFGAATAGMIVEALLFTQGKGLIQTLFGIGESIGEKTYDSASDIKSRMQANYVRSKEAQGERVNPDHHREMSERKSVQDFEAMAKREMGLS